MHLHFSKHLRLLIRSSSMQIKFQILSLILDVAAIEVSLSTMYSSTANCSSSASAPTFSRDFFSLFPDQLLFLLSKTLFSLFFVFALFAALISSFLLRQFCLSCLVDFVNCCYLFLFLLN